MAGQLGAPAELGARAAEESGAEHRVVQAAAKEARAKLEAEVAETGHTNPSACSSHLCSTTASSYRLGCGSSLTRGRRWGDLSACTSGHAGFATPTPGMCSPSASCSDTTPSPVYSPASPASSPTP
eukprot:3148657-Prymnesium_polylepis.1